MKNNTLTYRIERLEKWTGSLDKKMDKLLTNDLPHLQQQMVGIKTRMDVLTAVNLGAIILYVIMTKYL